ncbi:3'-5' exonuclease [Haladaptatus sp. AB643]|uniref:3'-5' exonuclease n=1 Tax=Haladaptatus sp. AB643 TaxID=2934174 RepID=UPI00209BEC80|nr:3'-5' exonuclease [Haladaptatus sp. AB643]MCO8244717.1 PD-(D/E)XK nuclease family protein [Haladaptatus sp. AB643]
MQAFRAELEALETIGGVLECVFSQYGYDGSYADVLLTTIQSVHNSTIQTRGDLIRFIETGIDEGSRHDVYASAGVNSVTVQTIHAAKGLEHPIVILANMNSRRFPPAGGNSNAVTFDDPIGLRQRKQYADDYGYPHIHDNWRTDVLRKCLPRDYDEERRLLYVAMTRAKSHLVFSAGENPNAFLEELPVDTEEYHPDVQEFHDGETTQSHFEISIPVSAGPVRHSPHSLMNDDVFEEVEEGRGPEFGTRTHEFAEQYVLGNTVEPANDDERHIKRFIDSLDGELRVEEDAYLPLTVDGDRVSIAGIIDLVHVCPEIVKIIDFKTDLSRVAESEYRKQLSVYYHVLAECFPERDVGASIFYTTDGRQVDINPLSENELREIVRQRTIQTAPSLD